MYCIYKQNVNGGIKKIKRVSFYALPKSGAH